LPQIPRLDNTFGVLKIFNCKGARSQRYYRSKTLFQMVNLSREKKASSLKP
jgi:hypothetical protein